jgi:hypothetical protein
MAKCKICQKDSIFTQKICKSCMMEVLKVREGILGCGDRYISPIKIINQLAEQIVLEDE